MEKIYYVIPLLALAAGVAVVISLQLQPVSHGVNVEIGGQNISAEIASSPQARQTGLMFRESLCIGCGMLFVFDEEGNYSFWMKNTLIPLDMVFIDANLTVVGLFHAVPCTADPCRTYASSMEALYVLETNADEFDRDISGSRVKIFWGG